MNFRWRVAQFFEIRWWRSYLRTKDKTRYYDWKRAYWRDFLQKSGIEPPKKCRVLDAGCGPAGIFTILETDHIDALDPLLGRYEQYLTQFRRADWPHVYFVQNTLEAYTPTAPYDLIFCLNVINHVESLPASLDRLVAWLAPDGTLALSIDAHNWPLLKHAFRLLPGDILHPHQHDLTEYTRMLTERGLVVERSIRIKHEFIFDYHLLVARRSI
jgi:trans-aconitate methyltransferase